MIKRYEKVIKNAKKFSLKKKRVLIPLLILVFILVSIAGLYIFLLSDLPSPTKLGANTGSYSSKIYDRNGEHLYTIYADRNQTFVPLKDIPEDMQHASIAIEDKDFYRHGAIDIRGITRALYSIIVHDELQGGSTLTQQLVKNSLLSPERTIDRKVKEVILSFATEALYPKDKILEMYLNQVPYGGTSYGVEAAAQTFFGKSVSKVSLAEAAFIAAMPESPSVLSPYGSRPELGKKRQEETLRRMQEQGYITKKEYDDAFSQKLEFQKISNPIKAPHFVFYLKDLLVKKYGEKVVTQGGLEIQTSLDMEIQEYAEASVSAILDDVKGYRVGNGGALITNPATGEVLAMVGGKDYFGEAEPEGCIPGYNCVFEPNVNVTLSKLQPGSSIKPINYAIGLMNGYTAATPFIDAAVCFPNPGQKPYCPKNYDNRFHGIVSMRQALANSYNIPAVQMLKINGVKQMVEIGNSMGLRSLTDPSRYGLALTLGGGEVTMTEMATAFGTLANQGYRVDLQPILKITNREGKVLEEYKPPDSPIFGKKIIPSEVAFIISDILSDNNARTPAFGPNSALRIPGKHVSVKTGTTNDYRDNWTIGYTPSYLVAVWVGNNDHSAMSGIVSGVTGAAPIWNNLMNHLLEGKNPEIPQKPPNVYGKYVCSSTGIEPREGQGCNTRFEYFVRGTESKSSVTIKKEKVFIDKTTGEQAKPGQTENVEEQEHDVITDSIGNKYCISCAQPGQPTTSPPEGQ